jgi:hypothetical protein
MVNPESRSGEWTLGRPKVFVTRRNLVRGQAQAYDAPILSRQDDAEKEPIAGTLSIEAQEQA